MNPIFPLKTDKTHRNLIVAWHLTTMLPVAEGICWLGLLQLHLWWHPNHTRIDRSGFKVRVEGWETLSMKHPNTAYVLDLVCNRWTSFTSGDEFVWGLFDLGERDEYDSFILNRYKYVQYKLPTHDESVTLATFFETNKFFILDKSKML